MRVTVRYLYTFQVPPEAVAAALAQGGSAITNLEFDVQSERNGDSGADAFADLETSRFIDKPALTVHLGRSSGLLVASHEANVESENLLQEEGDRTPEIIDFVNRHYGQVGTPALQWVHRLIVSSDAPEDEIRAAVLPLAYNTRAALSRTGSCFMGRGYSAVISQHPDQVDAVELGLVSAFQVHLLVGQVSREAAQLLTAVGADDLLSGETAAKLARRVSELIIRVRHIAEFSRRLRVSLLDARAVAFEATAAAWRLGPELEEVGDRVDACAGVVGAALDRQRSEREARRNLSLFVLAMLGVGQVIFATFDFVTSETTRVGNYPRPLILSLAVAVITCLILLDARRTRGRR